MVAMGALKEERNRLPRFFAVDFFCGGGGTTRGLIDAGGYVVAGIDKEPSCRETYERNNINTTLDGSHARYLQRDIFERTEDYPEGQGDQVLAELDNLLAPYQEAYPDIPLLFAICAPCQPFTQMTRIELSDERAMARMRDRGLLGQTLRYVREFSPQLILAENVAGIQAPKYGGVWQDFMEKLRELGYVVGTAIVDAMNYGVPQSRKRSILIAINKVDCDPALIVDPGTENERLIVRPRDPHARIVTVAEAIGHFPPVEAGGSHPGYRNHQAGRLSEINLRRIRMMEPGGKNLVLSNTELALPCHERVRASKGQKQAFSDIYTRMAPDKPAPTITTRCVSISNGRFGHYEQDRGITVREAAALQSFPDDYEFIADGLMACAKMVGNAVPPKLAQFFAEELANGLRKDARPFYCPDNGGTADGSPALPQAAE